MVMEPKTFTTIRPACVIERLTNEKRKNIIKHLKVLPLKSGVMKEVV